MKPVFCPRCSSVNITHKGGGYYLCWDCGYLGPLGIAKDMVKMVKK